MMTPGIKSTKMFHPRKFAMILAMASMTMLFIALSSAVIVRRGQGNWVAFHLPPIFWANTLIILLSSLTMWQVVKSFRKYNQAGYRLWLSTTLILGTVFLIGQYIGWQHLDSGGIHLRGNPSGSFLYVISGLHAAHILGGVIMLLVAVIRAFFIQFNPNRIASVQIMAMYWHFVDILWIYLLIFFQINLS
jgi:cytochrome c oxidase subunit 3